MAEGRGRARGYTPSQPVEQRLSEQAGVRRATDTGHSGNGNGNGNGHDTGNGNGDRPGGGRASHRGGAQGEVAPGEGGRQTRRVPRGRRAVQEDEAIVTYRGDPAAKHAIVESGTKIRLYANYVRFSKAKFMIYQYHVEFKPEFDNRRQRSDLVRGLLPGKPIRYDGRGLLFTTATLSEQEVMTFSVEHPGGAGQLEVTITLTNRFGSTDPQTIQFLNVAFGIDMRLIGMKRIQRHHFLVGERNTVIVQGRNAKLEVLPGFATAYSECDGGLLLNVDMVSKVLRAETVNETLIAALRQAGGSQSDAARAVIGQVVYAKYSNQTYRIEDIDWGQTPNSKFDKGGSLVSYAEYFKQRWNRNVSDMGQPLLVAKPRRIPGQKPAPGASEKVNLIPELVYLTGLTEDMRRDFTLTRSMAQTANANPQQRYERIKNMFGEMHNSAEVQSGWKKMGFEFDNDLATVEGHVIPNEELMFHNGSIQYDAKDVPDWSKNMRNCKLITGVKLERWLVLYPSRLENDTRTFIDSLMNVGHRLGMEIREPKPLSLPNDQPTTYAQALQRAMHGHDDVQLVVCVMMSSKKDTYDAIKKHCCLISPVPSQVLLSRTIGDPKKMQSVAAKVAIQINSKLGGEQWAANFFKLQSMIVGVDVYHDTTKRSQSHVGMVSSLNHAYTRFYSQSQAQVAGQEHVASMEGMIVKAIKAYQSVNNDLPRRIFYFRDGVSDGQLATVVNDELAQIDNAMLRFGPEYKPTMCVVVVKKRISARFMLQAGRTLENPPAGTVVDNFITKPNWCDFYLVSQSTRQGTVAPTHYNIVRNNTALNVNQIQRLSYKLTHLYYNWSGTIRVPAPCQYAHKLAFITGESLHVPAHETLADKLWFL